MRALVLFPPLQLRKGFKFFDKSSRSSVLHRMKDISKYKLCLKSIFLKYATTERRCVQDVKPELKEPIKQHGS